MSENNFNEALKIVFERDFVIEILFGAIAIFTANLQVINSGMSKFQITSLIYMFCSVVAITIIFVIEKRRKNNLIVPYAFFIVLCSAFSLISLISMYSPRNTLLQRAYVNFQPFVFTFPILLLLVIVVISRIVKESKKSSVAFLICAYVLIFSDTYLRLNQFAIVMLLTVPFLYTPYFAAKDNLYKSFLESVKFFARYIFFTFAVLIIFISVEFAVGLLFLWINKRTVNFAFLNVLQPTTLFFISSSFLSVVFAVFMLKASKGKE